MIYKTLVYIEPENIYAAKSLITAAKLVFENEKHEIYGVVINGCAKNLLGYFDKVISVSDLRVTNYDVKNISLYLKKINDKYKFDCIIFPASFTGRMVAPYLAMTIGVGLVADVTDIYRQDNVVCWIRPAFDGKMYATITNVGARPMMASIRDNVFCKSTFCKTKKTDVFDFNLDKIFPVKVEKIGEEVKPKETDIAASKVLVSGGNGTTNYFFKLASLAKILDGQVSASRRIVDCGMASRTIQVGQSGKIVAPSLYMAIGIYGFLQHVEGIKNAEHIISVNLDEFAPINSLADIVVVGDGEKFLNKLIARINK